MSLVRTVRVTIRPRWHTQFVLTMFPCFQEGRTTSPSLAGPVRTGEKYVELAEPFLPPPRQILIPLPTKTEVPNTSLNLLFVHKWDKKCGNLFVHEWNKKCANLYVHKWNKNAPILSARNRRKCAQRKKPQFFSEIWSIVNRNSRISQQNRILIRTNLMGRNLGLFTYRLINFENLMLPSFSVVNAANLLWKLYRNFLICLLCNFTLMRSF